MQVRHMEKRSRNQSQLSKARHFLQCVILEQRAATEELRANNSELERLLDEVVSSRSELRSVALQEAEEAALPALSRASKDRSVTELRREAEASVEQASAAIQASMRLRKKSERIREALRGGVTAKAPKAGSLSRREHQVLTLIVQGKSSKEIAAALGISFKTAVTHRSSIMSKLDVHEIASVVREAIRRGLV
jgi:DNA-binding NarL/FixJ family response regulator